MKISTNCKNYVVIIKLMHIGSKEAPLFNNSFLLGTRLPHPIYDTRTPIKIQLSPYYSSLLISNYFKIEL